MSCNDSIESLAYDFDQLGKMTPISKFTWRRAARRGLIKSILIGRRRLIPGREVRRALSEGVLMNGGSDSRTTEPKSGVERKAGELNA
jgi:hypothetical protein